MAIHTYVYIYVHTHREWFLRPSRDVDMLEGRLNFVSYMIQPSRFDLCGQLQEQLRRGFYILSSFFEPVLGGWGFNHRMRLMLTGRGSWFVWCPRLGKIKDLGIILRRFQSGTSTLGDWEQLFKVWNRVDTVKGTFHSQSCHLQRHCLPCLADVILCEHLY